MWTRLVGMLVITAGAAMTFGCSPKPVVPAAVIEDKDFTVTPATVQVKVGIVTADVADMKVTERVEKGSGRIDSPPRLTGTLKLKNGTTDQSVRLIGGKIQYIDADGKAIKLEETRNNTTITFSSERLDPGQEATKSVDVDFPAEALKAKNLKDIRLELTYLPSVYRDETVNLAVSIGGQ